MRKTWIIYIKVTVKLNWKPIIHILHDVQFKWQLPTENCVTLLYGHPMEKSLTL